MTVTYIKADGFRNLKGVTIFPSTGTNIIFGENAQGKTNLVEALWTASGERSFRGASERDLIAFEAESAKIEIGFSDSQREQKIEMILSKNPREKSVLLNGVKQRGASALLGRLLCVVFTPEDLNLTKGSPEIRRSYIDRCISQIKPLYRGAVARYERILAQRNAFLKSIAMGNGNAKSNSLDVWDAQIAAPCAYISMMRYVYTNVLMQSSKELYSEISRGKENLGLEYLSTVYKDLRGRRDYNGDMAKEYLELLYAERNDDIRAGFTRKGVHRDDISVTVDGLAIKDFGSQGQNRSAALCMKLGQAKVLERETEEKPVILLDDVMSELDKSRRSFIDKKITDYQVFITCCDYKKETLGGNKAFSVKSGRVGGI